MNINMATSMEPSLEPSAEHHHRHSHKRHHHKKHKKKHDKSDIKEDKKELVLDEQILLQALTSLDDQLMKDSNGESTGDEGDRVIAAMDRTTGQQCIVDTEKMLTPIKGDSNSSMMEQPQDKEDGSCVNDNESDSKTKHDKKHSKKKKKKHSKHKSSHHKRKHHSRKHSSRSASRTRCHSRSRSCSRSHSRTSHRSRTRSSSRTKYSRKKSHSRSRSRTRYSRTRYRSRTRSNSRTKYSKRQSRSRSPSRYRYSRTQSHSRTYPGRRYRSRTRSYSPQHSKTRHRTWYRHDNRRRSSSHYSSSDSDQGRDRKKRAESHTPPPQTIPTIITKPGDIKKETIAEYTKMCQQLSELEKTGKNDNTEGTTTAVQHHPFQMNADVVLPGMTANQVVLEMKPVEQVFPVSSGKEHQSSIVPQAQQPTVEDNEPVNVSALVVERAMLQQQLKANSNDIHVVLKLSAVEKKLANWSQGHVKPGLFTGGSEVIPMPKWEHDRGVQAWAKKNMFKSLAPVMSGFGMKMLVRMGWEMGQPLGKRGEGHTEPIPVDVKVDRLGLATVEDKQVPSVPSNVPAVTGKTSLAGKHPVSALQELCSKKSWGSPDYILISETGPSHMRSFMFKVTVEGVGTFQAACCSNNKKLAKAQAAIACLKSLGIFEEQEKNDQENTQK